MLAVLAVVMVVLLAVLIKTLGRAADTLARIERCTNDLRYRLDPTGRWAECRRSEERGKMIRNLMWELDMSKDTVLAGLHQGEAKKLVSKMDGSEIGQAAGTMPLNICSCGILFADADALAWHQARLHHVSWEEWALVDPEMVPGVEDCNLPPELENAGVQVGGPVKFEDISYPGLRSGVLEKVVRMPNKLIVALVRTPHGRIESVETAKINTTAKKGPKEADSAPQS